MKKSLASIFILALVVACAPSSALPSLPFEQATITASIVPTDTPEPTPTVPTETPTPVPPTETSTPTAIPFVDSLKATVTADRLSCRYGPGANYLFLFAFRGGANIKLIGRADGNKWILVENTPQLCWINSDFVQIQGDPQTLRSMYPDGYKIPVSPYYGPTIVTSATRKDDKITVAWEEVIVSPGKYEDENMFPYIVEVWRCENNQIIFDTLGARVPFITFVDQSGCDRPSNGRVYIQEKHGYAGPAEIPWPGY